MPGLFPCPAGIPIPEKAIVAAFFIAPTGRLRVLLDASNPLVSLPPIQRPQGPLTLPCWGIWGGPQQANFTGFCWGKNRENRKVCTTLPCLPLLRTVKRDIRIITIRSSQISPTNWNLQLY